MEKHAIERKLTSYVLASGTVRSADVVAVDVETLLPASSTMSETVERQWVVMAGRNMPSFTRRFPVSFAPGDSIHVLTMESGVTAKGNRPALVINSTTGQTHIEMLSPEPAGVLGFIFGRSAKWAIPMLLVLTAWILSGYVGKTAWMDDLMTVALLITAGLWSFVLVTELSYEMRARRRRREEISAVREATQMAMGKEKDDDE